MRSPSARSARRALGALGQNLVGGLAAAGHGGQIARSPRRRVILRRQAAEALDQIAVVATAFALLAFDLVEDGLDAIDGGQDEGHRLGGGRHAVAELAHQGFGGVRQRLEPWQVEKAACPLDGVHQAKNIAEDLAVIRLLLEAHEFGVDPIETLAGFGQELTQQLVHSGRLWRHRGHGPAGTRYMHSRGGDLARAFAARRTAPDLNPVCWQTV